MSDEVAAAVPVASALVHLPVLEGRVPAVYVAHRKSGEWIVAGPGFTDAPLEQFRRLELEAAVELLPVLIALVDLPRGRCAYRAISDHDWTRARIPEGSTFLLAYEVRPTELVSEGGAIGGAYVNCWVVARTLPDAARAARRHVEESGWAIVAEGKQQEMREEDLADGAEPYFRQAQVDGLVCVFHTYPSDRADA